MASISANGSKGHHKFTLTVTQSGTNVASNTSTVSFDFKISPIQNSWNWIQWGDSINYTITINGTNYTGSIPDYDGYSIVTLKTGSQSVTHNADGTKSISYSFSVTDTSGQSYTSGNASASGTLTLSTIPRATTPTFSAKTVTMGNSITLTINPAASTFKHKLRYSWSTLTQQTSGFSAGSDFTAQGNITVTFTPPTSLARYIPSNNSGKCTVQCYTYDASGNHIGTVSTDITVAVPSYTPTVTQAITGNNRLSATTYVQNKSTLTVDITASSSHYATIIGYSSVVDGVTYSGKTFTTKALSTGNKTVVTTITDSRGKTATVTSGTYTVYAYTAPQITSFTLARQSDGTTVIATVKGSISAVNNMNAKTIKVTLNGVTNTITSSAYTINGTTTFTNVPTDITLIGTAALTDSYVTVKRDGVLPTVAVTMDFLYDGKGIAMGKVAETTDTLEVAWKTKLNKATEIKDDNLAALTLKRNHGFNGTAIKFSNDSGVLGHIGMSGNTADSSLRRWTADASGAYFVLDTGNLTTYIKDYVIEQGTTSGWNYTKWNNGRIELYADKSLTFPAGTAQTTYLWRSIVSLNLSSILTTIIAGSCPIQVNGMIPQVCRHSTYPTTAEIVIVTSRTFDSFTITAPIYIIGKWK